MNESRHDTDQLNLVTETDSTYSNYYEKQRKVPPFPILK